MSEDFSERYNAHISMLDFQGAMSLCEAKAKASQTLEERQIAARLSVASALMSVEHTRVLRDQEVSKTSLEEVMISICNQVDHMLREALEHSNSTAKQNLAKRQMKSYMQAQAILHLINNDEWSIEAWELDCLKQVAIQNMFFKGLETSAHSKTQTEEETEEWKKDESGERLVPLGIG